MPQHSYFKTLLSTLPHSFQTSFFNQLNHLPYHRPDGQDRSWKIQSYNALFQSSLSPVSDVLGCTRWAQRFTIAMGSHAMTFIDLPGVGERTIQF